jgi:hypothetical protein
MTVPTRWGGAHASDKVLFFNAIQPISERPAKPVAAALDRAMQGMATTWLNAAGSE